MSGRVIELQANVRIVDPSAMPLTEYPLPEGIDEDKIRLSTGALVVRDCIGRSTHALPGPQAFLVRFPADSRGGAHFHPVDQFQIFYGSDGSWFKNQEITSGEIMLHYADAYVTYGPFGTKGPEPLEFFTLRA